MKSMTVDARGQLCPQPLILTKKALTESTAGQQISVLIDNETSVENVERFLSDNGIAVARSTEGAVHTLFLTTPDTPLSRPDAENYCAIPTVKTHVYCFTNNRMGHGDDDLGEILVKACINTIKETSPLPTALVFYNAGILLVTDDSPVCGSLVHLQNLGVQILVCGTCAEFFGKKEVIHTGTISNMYTILETLAAAGHIIYP